MSDAVAAFSIGLFALLVLFAASLFVGESVSRNVEIFNPGSFNDVVITGVRESIATGKRSAGIASLAQGGNVVPREIEARFSPRRAYYAGEFAKDVDVNVRLKCDTDACRVSENGNGYLEILRQAEVAVSVLCSDAGKGVECTVSVSDASLQEANIGSMSSSIVRNADSSIGRQLLGRVGPEIDGIIAESAQLKAANPVARATMLWKGSPQRLMIETVVSLANLAVIFNFASADWQYYYSAAKKYGLKYPDGSATGGEFIANMKRLKPPTPPIADQGELESACAESSAAGSGLFDSGLRKLTSRLGWVPLCVLKRKVDGLNRYEFSWAETLFGFPQGESEAEAVHRALLIWEFERGLSHRQTTGGPDGYPAIAAENQIAWLRSREESNASQRVTFYRNTTADFSSLRSIDGFKGVELYAEPGGPLSLEGDELKIGSNIEYRLTARRVCDPDCSYSVVISS